MLSGFAWLGIQVALGTPSAQQFQNYVSQKKKQLFFRYTAYSIGAISWFFYFTPVDRFGKLKNYILITKPLIALGLIISIQILLYLAHRNYNKKTVFRVFQKHNRPFLISTITLFLSFVLLWIFISISGMGIIPNGEDWNEAGVPVLGWQVFIALLVGMLLLKIERILKGKKLFLRKFDVVVFLLIWAIGGYLWASTPIQNGYLNPGPYPPTNETYPFADAARFDIMSQYALIGQGLNNGQAYNRPVYPAFLVYLHMLSGQNYAHNMDLQAALLALFPAVIYLIAKFLSNRSTGAALATIIILRGINGIAATKLINLANQKQMLTGFPTALLVGLILHGTLAWLRQPNKLSRAVVIGGIFGLGIYLRQTILGFFPVMVLLPFFTSKLKKQRQLIVLALFTLGMITFGIPYEFKNYVEHPNYRYPAVIRKIFTIAETHYIPEEETPAIRERSVSNDYRYSSDPPNTTLENVSKFKAVGNHFARNIVTSTLILPHSFSIDSLRNTIKSKNSFWRTSWSGRLSIEQSFFLILNLALVSIGIISSSYRFPIAGWIPLLFFFGYNIANAFARSSGGRYIVPVDWIIILYFIIGLFQLFMWIAPNGGDTRFIPSKSENQLVQKKIIPLTFLSVFVLGFFLIIPDFIFQKKFEDNNAYDIPSFVSAFQIVEKKPYIEELLSTENIVVVTGQIMYPRYYRAGNGEFSFYYPYKMLDYSRLAFILIGPNGTYNAIMPGAIPKGLSNLSEVIIIGCLKKDGDEKYIDVGLIFTISGDNRAFYREPLLEPTCDEISTVIN